LTWVPRFFWFGQTTASADITFWSAGSAERIRRAT
jgi:hypothetical protein